MFLLNKSKNVKLRVKPINQNLTQLTGNPNQRLYGADSRILWTDVRKLESMNVLKLLSTKMD